MDSLRDHTFIRYQLVLTVLLIVTVLTGRYAPASAGDDPISIGSITVNPQANNRRAVLFKGMAKNVRAVSGTDSLTSSACGQAFTLEDPTGSIDVWYLIKCRQEENVVIVTENDQILVAATIDAPPVTNMKTSIGIGSEPGFRAMATKLIHIKP